MPAVIETPFEPPGVRVKPEWIDYNGHMNVGYYHVAFDDASSPFFHWLGLSPEYRSRHQVSTFALETHLNFLREVKLGEPIRFAARLLSHDAKRIHFFIEMFHADEGFLAATYESLSMHVDLRTRRTSPMAEVLQQRMRAVMTEHAKLPRPWQAGHVIGAPVPRA
ncbi:MAG: thioesterase family protein [Betaproteobacteria bacterium]